MNLAGLFGIGLLMATLNSFAGSVMVETGNTRVLFSEETGGVLGIVDRTSGKNFISKVAEKPGLWRLKLRGGNGELIQLDSRSAARPGVYSQRGSVEFVWTNLQAKGVTGGFDVRVVCKVSHSDGLAHFRIDVQNKSNSSILSALFPELDGFGTAGTSDVAFPKYNWGEMFRGLKGKLYGNYPSADMPMQFCSITEGSNSVYFAAEDPGALFKTFLMEPGVTFSVETSVPNATIVGNNWKEAFDFVVGTYEGDWMRGCKLYREWALKSAPWTAKGPIARRKDVAKAVKEVGVWLNVSEHFVENEKSALAFRKEIGVPIGVQWYNWHRNPFDKEYPDYLPPKPGFVNSVKELKQAGIYSMPYINGRLWDTANTNYAEARPYATALENGERFLEDYQSGTKLAVMCLGNPFWQTNLAGLIERIAAETGVGGIYIDQVAGAPIAECFDPSHGHSLGRDQWWIDGYRKAIAGARNVVGKRPGGFFVAAENNAEPYMDFVDLFLIWIPRSENDIPMMTMVYSGYAQYFGTNRGSDSDVSFSMLQARDFAWGAQLFWESAFILSPDQREKLKILRNLAQLRFKERKYFVEGELLRVVQPITPAPKLSGRWGSWTGKLETRQVASLQGTLWKGSDGSFGVVIANADENEQEFIFDLAEAGLKPKRWQVRTVTTEHEEKSTRLEKNESRMSVKIPGRDGVILELK